MDRGLTKAVDRFARTVGASLQTAASGTSVDQSKLERDAIVEAFNLCVAFVDVDERHTDDELWAIVAAFAHHELLPGMATPDAMRRNDLVRGKRAWLAKPSDLFETLRQVDQTRGTRLARTYYDEAMTLAHTVASLDRYPSDDELKAIVQFQRLLMAALPTGRPAAATGTEGPGESGDAAEQAEPEAPLEPPEPLEDVLAELDALIGLDAVKEEVRLLSALLRVQKMREERDLPVIDSNNHLIFSGNPGTGKTTVGRLLARIYRSLGVVERGQLIEVDRSGLVAGFVGQTAKKVQDVFDSADGGVLLIDEAYSLTRGGEKDFGREAIDAVVKNVEDRRDSMVVILAGYPREMAELVATNPGFQSRFPKTITFPDYTDEELVAILGLISAGGTYHLTTEAEDAATAWFAAHDRGHGFGNGRLARNLFEAAVSRHATRLVEIEDPTDEQLTTLEAVDIAAVPTEDERAAPVGGDADEPDDAAGSAGEPAVTGGAGREAPDDGNGEQTEADPGSADPGSA
ncbi:MAG: AAA family ATPase, partial [Actinomycetota bacterium]